MPRQRHGRTLEGHADDVPDRKAHPGLLHHRDGFGIKAGCVLAALHVYPHR